MRTPGNDIDFAAGFISTEGIIKKRSAILKIAHCTGDKTTDDRNIINPYLYPDISIDYEKMIASSTQTQVAEFAGRNLSNHCNPYSPRLNQIFQSQLKSSIDFRKTKKRTRYIKANRRITC